MFDDISHIQEQAIKEIDSISEREELEELRVKYLGRKGLIANLFANIKAIAPEERRQLGKALNTLKQDITHKLNEKSQQLEEALLRRPYDIDITADGIRARLGREHVINQTIRDICAIFKNLGFEVVKGPEVETEFNNFTGLNIPLEHASRDVFDTFYLKTQMIADDTVNKESKERGLSQIKSSGRLLLRSHTSPVQIRVMKSRRPPLAVVVPGKVYRPDATDASHSFMFHQVEGFIVDETIAFSDLKGTLNLFAKKLFGPDIKMRFRPHFFPFTEPSVEVDISCIICRGGKESVSRKKHCSVCGGKGWLEVLGAGMIHPAVFKNVGYPPGRYSGFAFGMGVERIAMLKYGINDIRLFFENDLRFLRQF